jgi:ribonuclease Z
VDHVGGLPALLGMRGLIGIKTPLQIYLPAELVDDLKSGLESFSAMHRWDFDVELIGMKPGEELQVERDLYVRTFRTLHPVPSLGFLFLRRVQKLRPEFLDLPGPEIGRRRKAGEDLFTELERIELAYATDTLPEVLDQNPALFEASTLIIECTFLDERKSIENARLGCHIHLDELEAYFDRFQNDHIILMHFSQMYAPDEVHEILKSRCPEALHRRIQPLAPTGALWWD